MSTLFKNVTLERAIYISLWRLTHIGNQAVSTLAQWVKVLSDYLVELGIYKYNIVFESLGDSNNFSVGFMSVTLLQYAVPIYLNDVEATVGTQG